MQKKVCIPDLLSCGGRREWLDLLAREEYGVTPEAPREVLCDTVRRDSTYFGGACVREDLRISFAAPLGTCSFPLRLFLPTTPGKHPLIVFLNFPSDKHAYFPAEEIVLGGWALAVLTYTDVTSDDGDFTNGIAGLYPRDGETGWGKIGMWAFAASRVIDALSERGEIAPARIAVCGHSRLGKTALWCAAQDERVRWVYSNDSGCSGAAYARDPAPGAESVSAIIGRFPYWFSGRYGSYSDGSSLPFDQHFLLAAIAPRYLCVGSASEDAWASPASEERSCFGASAAWEALGLPGYVSDAPAGVGERRFAGSVGYHLRAGLHDFTRRDWLAFLDFIKTHP